MAWGVAGPVGWKTVVLGAALGWAAGAPADEAAPPDMVKAGPFERIFDQSVGEDTEWAMNDHCVVRDEQGLWHMFGITHPKPFVPFDADNFAHATARKLTQSPWDKLPFAMTVDPAAGEEHLWAPHVVRHKGLYYMYYCAGNQDHTRYRIHLTTSPELKTWTRHPANPLIIDGFDARDPFVLRLPDQWVMYYTATLRPDGGNHVVVAATSDDLVHWRGRTIVLRDPSVGQYGGPTESPFVVRRGPYYYLFCGPREGYVGTTVFRSRDPLRWSLDDHVGHIASHAAEVVRDVDGKWYVTHCGWGQKGLYLAPLDWNDGLDDAPTSLPPPGAKSPAE
ncbi:MAG: family 43 glycosylhydrolase [Pirellulales bacterium]|nr:family 43 glycosylhydrolase [Pirellulales bacterium]